MGNEVIATGPLFDGRADGMVTDMLTQIRKDVGDYALTQWQGNLGGSLRHPTGRYQSGLHAVDRDLDRVVNDGWGETNQLPYGPWLEGVGSRNSPVTRFPGYRALQRAFEATKSALEGVYRPIVDKWMVKLNGD